MLHTINEVLDAVIGGLLVVALVAYLAARYLPGRNDG